MPMTLRRATHVVRAGAWLPRKGIAYLFLVWITSSSKRWEGENAKAGSKPLRWDDHEGDCEPFLGVVSLVCIFCLRDVCHQTADVCFFFFFLNNGSSRWRPNHAMWSCITFTWTSELGMWETGVLISKIDIFAGYATRVERIKKERNHWQSKCWQASLLVLTVVWNYG